MLVLVNPFCCFTAKCQDGQWVRGWAGEGEVAGPMMLGQGGREPLAVQWLGLSAFNL